MDVATPTITPSPAKVDLRPRAADPTAMDPASVAQILITALPVSLRELGATNVPAASRVLWSEFLDDKKPDWFTALPSDVQGYLSSKYGPSHASTTDSTNSATSSSTPTSTPTSAPSNPPSNGLPMGAKIGIAVGAGIGGLILLAVLFGLCVLCQRRRRRQKAIKRSNRPSTPMAFAGDSGVTHGVRDHSTSRSIISSSDLSGHKSTNSPHHYASNNHPDLAPPVPVALGSHRSARGSRMSFSSLHSVREEPETDGHGHGHGPEHDMGAAAMPARTPRGSFDAPQRPLSAHNRASPMKVNTGNSPVHHSLSPQSSSTEFSNGYGTPASSVSPINGHNSNNNRNVGSHHSQGMVHPAYRDQADGNWQTHHQPHAVSTQANHAEWPLPSHEHGPYWKGDMYDGVQLMTVSVTDDCL